MAPGVCGYMRAIVAVVAWEQEPRPPFRQGVLGRLRPFRSTRTARRRLRAIPVRSTHRHAKLGPAHRHPGTAPRTRARAAGLVSLAEARELAVANRKLARSGGGPLSEKRSAAGVPSFAEAAERVLEQKRGGWRTCAAITRTTAPGPVLGRRATSCSTCGTVWPASSCYAERRGYVSQRVLDDRRRDRVHRCRVSPVLDRP